ncbi:MAG: 16S rRNA (cytosine(1402)-N(4))-methyltransferase RsmH [Planctomycetota bacterium]|nr:16S rRNA (cytosine(1402)-N(4))-methyltransferase RsmH [Planctomycetota bacterium]HBO50965.1 16S rRNA (cytosine(1402)-N(4))-methyltransferase [Planctomycetota bacterium]
MNAEPEHLPVMLEETLRCLAPRPGETMLDGTLGLGGHAAEILSRLSPGGELIGLDRDPEALTLAAKRLDGVGGNYRLLHGTFDRVGELLKELELSSDGAFDGLLLDLGVSSMQLDRAERGFSFRNDGPLDMRMDPGEKESAASWLAQAPVEELARVIRRYGEEPQAGKIARAIDRGRRERPITTTAELASLIEELVPRRGKKIHPATKTFQAIRIVVNRELDCLRDALEKLDRYMKPGGRVVVLSYHSLEDRIVKTVFRDRVREGFFISHPDGLQRPTQTEVQSNRRSRSARLRAVVRAGEAWSST